MNLQIDETVIFDLVARQISNYIHRHRQFQKLPDEKELYEFSNVLRQLKENHYEHRDMSYIETSLNFLIRKYDNPKGGY